MVPEVENNNNGEEQKKPRGFREWWKHAFAIEKYDESCLSGQDKQILEKIARRVVEKRMTAMAILWAESHRNLNWVSSQVMVMVQPAYELSHPFLQALTQRFGVNIKPDEYQALHAALEKRYSVEYFIQKLEAYESGDYNDKSADGGENAGDAANTKEE